MTYDEIGVPRSDFFPYPPPVPGAVTVILGEKRPPHTLSNGAWGLRLSSLAGGFDVAGFYYNSVDVSPAFTRTFEATDPAPTAIFQPDHARIWQAGTTVSKDLGSVVVKAEAVYTSGRRLPVTRVEDADGLVGQNTIDAILAAEYTIAEKTRFNLGQSPRATRISSMPRGSTRADRSMFRPRRWRTGWSSKRSAYAASRTRAGWRV